MQVMDSPTVIPCHTFTKLQGKALSLPLGFSNTTSKMSDWHMSSHPRNLTSEFPKLILEGKDISRFFSSHVKRWFCFLNAFAMSSTWDLQIHRRSWFAHHCWMQASVMRAQLSMGSEAGCQPVPSSLLPPPHPLNLLGRFRGSCEEKQIGFEGLG